MLNTEQFTATNKANFEAMMGLTTKAFEGVEQLAALNLQVVKASLDEATEAGRAALSTHDPQSLLALQAGSFAWFVVTGRLASRPPQRRVRLSR